MYTRGSFVFQKCYNYALTNLLFSLCNSMQIIDPLVIPFNPHPKVLTHVLRSVPQPLLPLFSLLHLHLSLSKSLRRVKLCARQKFQALCRHEQLSRKGILDISTMVLNLHVERFHFGLHHGALPSHSFQEPNTFLFFQKTFILSFTI